MGQRNKLHQALTPLSILVSEINSLFVQFFFPLELLTIKNRISPENCFCIMTMNKFLMTYIIRFLCSVFHCSVASFLLTGQKVYWAQTKSFSLDAVVSKLCGLTHRESRSSACYVPPLYSFSIFSLFLSPLYTFAHIPTPIFTVWTCTDCGQQSIWDNGDCQCNVSHLERPRERGREEQQRERTLFPGSYC